MPELLSTAIVDLYQAALRHHRARRFPDAARMYEQVLRLHPRHADSLHLLGLIAYESQRHAAAIELIQQAIAIHSRCAPFHCNLGLVLTAQGRLEEAAKAFRRAMALDPALAEAPMNLGVALQSAGKLEEAEEVFQQALERHSHPALFLNLGSLLHLRGKLEQAVACYERSIALHPNDPSTHYNLGNVLREQVKRAAAAERYRQALALDPGLFAAHVNLGNVLREEGENLKEALAAYRAAVRLRPGNAEAHYNVGQVLQTMGELDQAVEHYRIALDLDPSLGAAHYNLGRALRGVDRHADALAAYECVPAGDPLYAKARLDAGRLLFALGRHDEAIAAIGECLASKPDCAEAWCSLGAVFHARDETSIALEYYRRALEIDPETADARLNQSYIELISGDFAAGWRNFEARWGSSQLAKRAVPQPRWEGGPLHGKTIAIHAEQGLGDTIQFLRYVPMVAKAGGRVVLVVPKRMLRLAATLPGVAVLRSFGEVVPDFDCHCPLLSLPLAFGTTLETIPAETPYLSVPEPAKQAMADFPWARGRLRVGLAWAGAPLFLADRFRCRSIPFPLLAPFFGIEGVAWYSLQFGEAASEFAQAGGAITDLSPYVTDMADTAAQIANLDLVVSVDTAVAHLAGALGVPTLVLLPFMHDWRWLREREDSPWYPAMRLLRQPSPGNGPAVIDRARYLIAERAEVCVGQDDAHLSDS